MRTGRKDSTAILTFLMVSSAASLSLGSCASNSGANVIITKQAPSIERKLFDPGRKPRPAPDESAETQWYFHVKPDFKYDVVSEHTLPSGEHVAVIEVSQVLLNLSLPITVWLPENAPGDVKAHEDGHVKICTDVYEYADRAATEAAQPILKTVFQGQGPDQSTAVHKAVDCAAQALASEYRRNTSDVVNRVSSTYDEFTANSQGSLPPDRLVQEAFARRGIDLAQGRISF